VPKTFLFSNEKKWNRTTMPAALSGPLVIVPKPSMWDYKDAKGMRVYKPTAEKVTSRHDWMNVEILVQVDRVRWAFNGVEVMGWRGARQGRFHWRAASRLERAAGSVI
jgi:hypothetical protein